MPVIDFVPLEFLDPNVRTACERAISDGRLASMRYPQVLAYSSTLAQAAAAAYAEPPPSLISSRLRELIRLRSAQLGGCAECKSARYDEDVDDSTARCVLSDFSGLKDPEAIVMRFVTLMHVDHHSIDRNLYLSLAQYYSTAQIVEIGAWTAQTLGSHRFLHTLDLLGDGTSALPFDPREIDRVRSATDVTFDPDLSDQMEDSSAH